MSRRSQLLAVIPAVLAALAGLAAAQQCKCPEPKTQANFDAKKYMGKWYEMSKVVRGYEKGGTCGTASYKLLDNGTVDVVNTDFRPATAATYTVNLQANAVDLSNAKFRVSWPANPNATDSDYWVLGTDYSTYSVVYACAVDVELQIPQITLWVLARDPDNFDANTQTTVDGILKSANLDKNEMAVTEQHHCPSASCSACPSAKKDVDVGKLKGTWWQIQHSPFSTGADTESCGVVQFTATDDGISAWFLVSEKNGSEAFADHELTLNARWKSSTDKTGEMILSGDGDTLCIIDTDYDNWAVVSICRKTTNTNLPPGFESAVSGGLWVMSRRRGLSTQHQMEANKAVVSAGMPASAMQPTMASPCTEKALKLAMSSAPTALMSPVFMLLSILLTSLRLS